MDGITDFDNLDVMVVSVNFNPVKKELARVFGKFSIQYDTESNLPAGEDFPQENELKNQNYGNNIPRHEGILESLETFTNEVNLRLIQEMDSMMSMLDAQINGTINSAISDGVIPEIFCELVCDTEASLSPHSQENGERTTGLKNRTTKKDSRSACDLQYTEGLGSLNNISLTSITVLPTMF